jgi:hypothetical protein
VDFIDIIGFLGWSAMLVGLLDFTAMELLLAQATWLAVAFFGRKIIDIKFECREGHDVL